MGGIELTAERVDEMAGSVYALIANQAELRRLRAEAGLDESAEAWEAVKDDPSRAALVGALRMWARQGLELIGGRAEERAYMALVGKASDSLAAELSGRFAVCGGVSCWDCETRFECADRKLRGAFDAWRSAVDWKEEVKEQ